MVKYIPYSICCLHVEILPGIYSMENKCGKISDWVEEMMQFLLG